MNEKVNFLFWNINKKMILEEIKMLVDYYNIDVLLLAENNTDDNKILGILNSDKNNFYASPGRLFKRISIYSKFENKFIKEKKGHGRYKNRNFALPGKTEILLVVIHYQDKRNWTSADQNAEISNLMDDINEKQKEYKHRRTIIVGDFNMNPFEQAMVQHTGLHSVQDKNIAKTKQRKVAGKNYHLYYNPMWNFFGDTAENKIPGTYYYNSGKPINYYWNMFDQVIVGHELIDSFDSKELNIINKIGNINLLNSRGIINKKDYSDHLPIKFQLNIN